MNNNSSFFKKTAQAAVLATLLGSSLLAQNGNRATLKPGNTITVEKKLDRFTKINASSAFGIEVVQDAQQSVTIEAPENFIPYYSLEVKDGTLKLRLTNDDTRPGFEGPMGKIVIHMPELQHLDLSGACWVKSKNKLSCSRLACDLSGASSVELDLDAKNMEFDISGASTVELSGKVSDLLKLDVSGSSSIRAYDLKARNVDCDLSGVCKVELYAEEKLEIDASGMSQVKYKGDAKVVAQASGMSTVSKSN